MPCNKCNLRQCFHTVHLQSAPESDNKYIKKCAHSKQIFFDNKQWEHCVWTEKDFWVLLQDKEWNIPNGAQLLSMGAWAIVSDFLRMYALYKYGGVYADWDVEFVAPFPLHLLEKDLVLGFEPYTYAGIGTQQVGMQLCTSKLGHDFWKLLYRYAAKKIWTQDFDILPGLCTRLLEEQYGLGRPRLATQYYYLKNGICIVPNEYMYPYMGTKDWHRGQGALSPYTFALHWEHSQIEDKDGEKIGWTHYLHALKKRPSVQQ